MHSNPSISSSISLPSLYALRRSDYQEDGAFSPTVVGTRNYEPNPDDRRAELLATLDSVLDFLDMVLNDSENDEEKQ